jgi:ABC-2 type transport system ATP-binding protein
MIELQELTKTYAKKNERAVDSLSLSVSDGEIFGFLGPNGAGKTTTIKMIAGIIEPDRGESCRGRVLIDGIEVRRDPLEAKTRISYVPDNPELFVRLKASEYLNFLADVYGVSGERRRERISEYSGALKIDDALSSRITSFSHGMKQKLVLVGSLVNDPQNWILDEPLVGLDPEAAFVLKDIMRKRSEAGKTVFFSTHVMEVAERLCTRLAIIAKGKLVFAGTMDELRARGGAERGLERLFLEMVDSDLVHGKGDVSR